MVKGIITRVKRQSMEYEKIFSSHLSGKRLTSQMRKKLLQLGSRKITQMKNRQMVLNIRFKDK